MKKTGKGRKQREEEDSTAEQEGPATPAKNQLEQNVTQRKHGNYRRQIKSRIYKPPNKKNGGKKEATDKWEINRTMYDQ